MWKYEDDALAGKPKNVLLKKWLPQQDLLGHPSIKCFITQGGLQSLEEAIISGVPLIAIPFIADQFYNAERIRALGIGLHLDFQKITKNVFNTASRRSKECIFCCI